MRMLDKLNNFVFGIVVFFKYKKELCFDEWDYIERHILTSQGVMKNFWMRHPKLHFSFKCRDNTELQESVLGGRLESCDWKKHLAEKLDPRRPTVLIITHDVTRTGAPRIALEILRHYSGTHNTVFYSLCGGNMIKEFSAVATCSAFHLGASCLQERLQRELKLIMKVAIPELAIVNSIGSASVLPVLAKAGIPKIHLIHEIADLEPISTFEQSAQYSEMMVFPAEFVKAHAMRRCPKIASDKVAVIPQGVFPKNNQSGKPSEGIMAVERPSGATTSRPLIIHGAGTVQFRKGVDLFLQCADILSKMKLDQKIKFQWTGAGFNESDYDYSAYLRHQIHSLGLTHLVEMTSEMDDLDEAYCRADIFFLSSRFDPLPLVAQEAMDHALPLVCFDDSGGIPEFLKRDPVASYGVVPYLDVNAAAGKIAALIRDPQLRERVGNAGKLIVDKNFNAGQYFSALDDVARRIRKETGKRVGQPVQGKL